MRVDRAWKAMLAAVVLVLFIGEHVFCNEIKLPQPRLTGKLSVEAAMAAKKSVRNFSGAAMTLAEAGQMLWAANGNLPTDAVSGATTKVIPSAGGLYPLEVFLLTGPQTVQGLDAGIYQYEAQTNTLQLVASGDNRALLAHASLSQMWIARAPAVIVVVGMLARTTSKYGNRGMNYVFMEAGNSNQNLYLQAAALGLGIGTIGAFNDAQVAGVLKLQTGVLPLLVMAVGK